VSQVDGTVHCFDDRTAKSNSTSELNSTFTLHAHDKSVSSIRYNPLAPNVCILNILTRICKCINYVHVSLTLLCWHDLMQLLATGSLDRTVIVKSIFMFSCYL